MARSTEATLNTPLLSGSGLDAIATRQAHLEHEALKEGADRYWRSIQDAYEHGKAHTTAGGRGLLRAWVPPVTEAIRAEVAKRRQLDAWKITQPILSKIPPARLARWSLLALLDRLLPSPAGESFTSVVRHIGRRVLADLALRQLTGERRERFKAGELEGHPLRYFPAHFANLDVKHIFALHRQNLSSEAELREARLQICIGDRLLHCITEGASAPVPPKPRDPGNDDEEMEPDRFVLAVYRWSENYLTDSGRPRTRRLVRLTTPVFAFVDHCNRRRQFLRPKFKVMVTEPPSWTPGSEGGYTRHRIPYITNPTPHHRLAVAESDMTRPYHLLTIVNRVHRFVNDGAVEQMQEMHFARGGGSLGIPAADDLPKPRPPAGYDARVKGQDRWRDVPDHVRQLFIAESRRVKAVNRDVGSDRKLWEGTLAHRREVRGGPAGGAFHIPQNVDFRGRSVAKPAYLNHLMDDRVVAPMLFADPVEKITDRGRRWLQIHAANCWGIDKVCFDDRVAWAEANADELCRCATDPWNTDFWQFTRDEKAGKKTKPWAALMAARALADDEVGRRVPIAQDGTCNGLQHWAAAIRDETIAPHVNLVRTERPGDIYRRLADAVLEIAAEDTRSSEMFRVRKNESQPLARMAELGAEVLDRDIAKVVAMPFVYGQTLWSARRRVGQKLKERGHDPELRFAVSRYLADRLDAGMARIAPRIVQAMQWVRSLAPIILKKHPYRPVQWTSPTGHPVVLSYSKPQEDRFTLMCAPACHIKAFDPNAPMDLRRTSSSMPPHWVHSRDKAHMQMIAEEIYLVHGRPMMTRHDDFRTDCEHVDAMREACLRHFYTLYAGDPLADFKNELESRFGVDLPDPPERGTWDPTSVLEATYFVN